MLLQIALLFAGFLLLPLQATLPTYSFEYQKYIKFHWKGAITSHSITLKVFPTAELLSSGYNTFFILYTKRTDSTLEKNQIKPVTFTNETYSVTKIEISGLNKETEYFYGFEFTLDNSISDISQFKDASSRQEVTEFYFKTFDIALKPYSFKFGASSCSKSNSNAPVFINLVDEKLDFFLNMGDMHYENIGQNNVTRFYEAYYKVFSSPNQKKFYESTPLFYIWDDHDFGPNNADGRSASKPAAHSAYMSFVPHSPLKNYLPIDDSSAFPHNAPRGNTDSRYYLSPNTQDHGIFRSFVVGRCLFIIMDLRSFQDVVPGDVLGEEQRTWLENQIRYAGVNQGIKMVFLISSFPWLDTNPGSEWEGFKDTQQWIGVLVKEYIHDRNKAIMLLSGDAHMVAFDDGSNNPFGGFPVVQAAALDSRPSNKGGPYSHELVQGRNQYGVLEVDDDGHNFCVKVNLKGLEGNIIEYDSCYPDLYPIESKVSPHPVWLWAAISSGAFGVLLLTLGSIRIYRRRKSRSSITIKPEENVAFNSNYPDSPLEADVKPNSKDSARANFDNKSELTDAKDEPPANMKTRSASNEEDL